MTFAPVSTPFVFLAVTQTGRRRLGVRYAADRSELSSSLSKESLLLLRTWRLPSWTGRVDRLSLKDQVALNEQIGALVDRGVPLIEALQVAQTVVSKRAAPTVAKLRELVSSGDSFAGACEKTGAFDSVLTTVYRAAERSGQLGDSARRLALSARRRLAIASKVATMMIYPSVVLAVAVIVTVTVLTMVVPRVAETLEQAEGGLPWYTQVVISAGVGLRDNWLNALAGVGVLLVIGVLLRTATLRFLSEALRRAPLFGAVTLASESARFFSVMAAMTRTGVPLAEALSVATGVIGHPGLRRQLEELGRGLVEGGVLQSLIERIDLLPLATRRLLIAADRAGDMDQVFDTLAEDLAAKVDTQTERAIGLLEPMLIVGVFLVIGSVLISVMLPLMTLGANTKGL